MRCSLTFSRADVRAKHFRSAHLQLNHDSPRSPRDGNKRARTACEDCRKKKIRCVSPHQHAISTNSGASGDGSLEPVNSEQTLTQTCLDDGQSSSGVLAWPQDPSDFSFLQGSSDETSLGQDFGILDSWDWPDPSGALDWVSRRCYNSLDARAEV